MKHWSKVEYLHETVKNPNIHIKGTRSYYSDAWTGSFEESVVRYLYGDEFSSQNWDPQWEIDQLYIGNFVCIAAEAVILMGGNHTHRLDWFSCYPFLETLVASYEGKGDTVIDDGAWIGMRAMIMPGVRIREGAVIAANSVVANDVPPYSIVGGNPAKLIQYRFEPEIIERLLKLKLYEMSEDKFSALQHLITASDVEALESAYHAYDQER
ncbi:CatB-related O-acetyltransferase [Algicola sagamiensis]|uniref:CatB-related O-acetyltransferase n=1 Tax=Algicola sagamiensis TaxID=163869 RepID=UPI00037ED9E9|nr:CatB-related O-acetyltransferase [Algicola sagamiensis]